MPGNRAEGKCVKKQSTGSGRRGGDLARELGSAQDADWNSPDGVTLGTRFPYKPIQQEGTGPAVISEGYWVRPWGCRGQ